MAVRDGDYYGGTCEERRRPEPQTYASLRTQLNEATAAIVRLNAQCVEYQEIIANLRAQVARYQTGQK